MIITRAATKHAAVLYNSMHLVLVLSRNWRATESYPAYWRDTPSHDAWINVWHCLPDFGSAAADEKRAVGGCRGTAGPSHALVGRGIGVAECCRHKKEQARQEEEEGMIALEIREMDMFLSCRR
jgi:hypothetical protein